MNVSALVLPITLVIVFYLFLIRPQQKHVKEYRETTNRIKAGQKITTTGGIKGTVKVMDETAVVATVNGHDTGMTFEKPAIRQVDPP